MAGPESKGINGLPKARDASSQSVTAGHGDSPLNVAVLGGGPDCLNLLRFLDQERSSRLNVNILGIFDKNPVAPGILYAQSLKLKTTQRFQDLLEIEGLNLIIELTASPELLSKLQKAKPQHVSIIDHRAARFIGDLIHCNMKEDQPFDKRQDYTEREQKHVQLILDSLPYRIMVVGLDKTIKAVNRTFLKEYDLTRNGVIGERCYNVRYGLNGPCSNSGKSCILDEHMEEILNKGLFSTFEEVVDEKGQTRYDVVTIAPIYDEDGHIVQILEASRDVTERVKLEEEVRKSKSFFEKVIQSTVDGIVVVDTRGNVLIFNEGMQRLTGYSDEEIISRGHLSSFYDIEIARENMKKMRSDQYGPPGKLNPIGMVITSKGGEEIPVTLSASIIYMDEKEIGSVGIFTDMREVLRMRKELEETNLQLVQSQKIASVGRMAAGVAHEINNPLSAILIYTELLKEVVKDNSQGLKDIQEIIDQTMRCKKIVSELLEFSRKSAGRTASFSLAETINKCLSLLTSKAAFQDIHVTATIDPNMPEMTGDNSQIQQVFTNLFMNAADAMNGKGKLTITARYDHDASMFIVKISDTGPGIPEQLRDRVFDIFFTSKPVGRGTGLGLSISQNIVKLHGGNIFFECPPQCGTTFVVELPLKYAAPPEEDAVFMGLDES